MVEDFCAELDIPRNPHPGPTVSKGMRSYDSWLMVLVPQLADWLLSVVSTALGSGRRTGPKIDSDKVTE